MAKGLVVVIRPGIQSFDALVDFRLCGQDQHGRLNFSLRRRVSTSIPGRPGSIRSIMMRS